MGFTKIEDCLKLEEEDHENVKNMSSHAEVKVEHREVGEDSEDEVHKPRPGKYKKRKKSKENMSSEESSDEERPRLKKKKSSNKKKEGHKKKTKKTKGSKKDKKRKKGKAIDKSSGSEVDEQAASSEVESEDVKRKKKKFKAKKKGRGMSSGSDLSQGGEEKERKSKKKSKKTKKDKKSRKRKTPEEGKVSIPLDAEELAVMVKDEGITDRELRKVVRSAMRGSKEKKVTFKVSEFSRQGVSKELVKLLFSNKDKTADKEGNTAKHRNKEQVKDGPEEQEDHDKEAKSKKGEAACRPEGGKEPARPGDK